MAMALGEVKLLRNSVDFWKTRYQYYVFVMTQ